MSIGTGQELQELLPPLYSSWAPAYMYIMVNSTWHVHVYALHLFCKLTHRTQK